ncbi:tRNA pseudouridine(55) synthase TruB [soil metagenome]
MKKRGTPIHGWIALDKPEGIGSTQALAKVKHLLQPEKAGHGGTLDPLASGLLPIALGEATKTVAWAMDGAKTYQFTIRWGEERSTDDREGEVIRQSDARPAIIDIESILHQFKGSISQVPPAFSALKLGGERAYDLARSGQAVDLAARTVIIDRLVFVDGPDADHARFAVDCGKGTYIRALARDMARALGTAGHVSALRRTRVGPFGESHMISLETLAEMRHKAPGDNAMKGVLHPIETVLDGIPALAVTDVGAQRLKQGQKVLLRGANAPVAQDAVLVTWDGKPLGICSIEQGSLTPKRLFNLS